MQEFSATYSPEDNKLRLSAVSRLDKELYERVKAAGFSWAPKQEIFVAPMWTPSREDLLLELCGEIDDEDTTLVDRAERRAERFEGYKENRIADAEQARAAVDRIADGIPFGQPILVGHHSERHARKDAERIQNGMAKTVKMWQTATYWQRRAAGALHHAKYKELPGVRHRRIKGIEADKRKQEKNKQEADMWLKLWTACGNEQDKELQQKVALRIANMCHLNLPRKEGDRPDFDQCPSAYTALSNGYPNLYAPRTVDEVVTVALESYPRAIAGYERWIEHYTNRIAYEKAMLGESGGIAAQKFDIQVGGRVLIGSEWLVVLKLNKSGGVLNSVSTSPRQHYYGKTYKADIETVKDYRDPTGDEAVKVKAAMKLPPLCNYPGEGCVEMTEAEWKKVYTDHKGTNVISLEEVGKHRRRYVQNFIARRHGLPPGASQWGSTPVFITDAKRVDPSAARFVSPAPAEPFKREIDLNQQLKRHIKAETEDARIPSYDQLQEMKQAVKAGVQVVAVPQLFPTPPDLAARMVELAEIEDGQEVLEPSAGTGAIVDAVRLAMVDGRAGRCAITAVEINLTLAHRLAFHDCLGGDRVTPGDFLEQNGNLGKFDRILMNPPFVNADDIKHIEHAVKFLKPGGRLVAICAGGSRQEARLMPLCDTWEPLPPGTFKDSGTGVNTVLLSITV